MWNNWQQSTIIYTSLKNMYPKPGKVCWTAMFSRTGYELYCIIKNLKTLPTQIICNRKPLKEGIDEKFWNVLQAQNY